MVKGESTELVKKKRKNVTDGIDVHQWVPKDCDVEISLWDFAGQEIYYTTHQFFISSGALYLIVFNVVKPLREARILFWLNSIQSRVAGQQVLIIATHVDKIKATKEREELLTSISSDLGNVYKQWSRNFPTNEEIVTIIANKKENLLVWPVGKKIKENLMNIKEAIIENATMKESVPNSYIFLLQKIIKMRAKKAQNEPPISDLGEIEQWASKQRIHKFNNERLRRALRLFHEWGEVIYFANNTSSWHLTQKICLNPKWLSELFKTVSSFKHLHTNGYQSLITKAELEQRWIAANFPTSLFPYLFELLEQQYQIIVHLPEYQHKTPTYLIPSLLSSSSPSNFWLPLNKRNFNSSNINNNHNNINNNIMNNNNAQNGTNTFGASPRQNSITTSFSIVCTNIEYFREYHLPFMPHGIVQ